MNLTTAFHQRWFNLKNQVRLNRIARQVADNEPSKGNQRPIIVFNASTRIRNISQNAAFSLLTSWGLRLSGINLLHYVCQSGMQNCVLGTNHQNYLQMPPCQACIDQSRQLYSKANVQWFTFQTDQKLIEETRSLNIDELVRFEYPIQLPGASQAVNMPLGQLVLPSLRWALRRHTLVDNQDTAYLMRAYIHSAYSIAQDFAALVNLASPAAALIFNGVMYPEATVRWVCNERHVPVMLHEVGFRPFSAFFTSGEATAYPIPIPNTFRLNDEQNSRLDGYLEKRFQGKFSMAGIQFWPEMRGLDKNFLEKAARFKQIVPVFTNVIYDTSQIHANQVFANMFSWLDNILETIRNHTETLFVIRAHPDEMRLDSAKQSNESVRDWVEMHAIKNLPNVVFIDSQEFISSYELIQRAKFILVYNSSIGLEAALMGAAVLCGGKARYTQIPMVFFPQSQDEYIQRMEEFLEAERIQVPEEYVHNARRFLYYQLYRASLSFEDYLIPGPRKGFVGLNPFSWKDLLPENSTTIQHIGDGFLKLIQQSTAETNDSDQVLTILLRENE